MMVGMFILKDVDMLFILNLILSQGHKSQVLFNIMPLHTLPINVGNIY